MLKKRIRGMLIALLIAVVAAGVAAGLIVSHPMFGKLPAGKRLERLRASPNYQDGAFVNRVPKPHMVEGVSMFGLARDFFFRDKERLRPSRPLPVEKPELAALPPDEDVVIWLGHSSLYLQLDGKRFLVDPNFTSVVSPFTWRTYAFEGTTIYSPDDVPPIDFLLITHDHFDHLSHETVAAIKDRVGKVICGLGVGEHLEYWGVPAEKIVELDWEETHRLTDTMTLHCESTHHFSGRTLWKRNPTLWAAFVVETSALRLYIGGDSGYGPHFADTGKRLGPFDLAMLENGQYDPNWKYNHMRPEEAARAARDLGAKRVLPLHAGRFVLANHVWDEPFVLLAEQSRNEAFELITPKIGEPVYPRDPAQSFTKWWEGVDE